MTYVRATLAALGASAFFVLGVLVYESIRATNLARKKHPRELAAFAGTYTRALHSRVVQILAIVFFAVAFYVVMR